MKINKSRLVSVAILISLILSFIGYEWAWGRYDQVPTIIRHATRFLPLIIVSLSFFIKSKFNDRNRRFGFGLWYNIWVVSILLLLFFRVIVFPGNERMLFLVLQILQAILFGYAGYWLIRNKQETFWLLGKIAAVGALVGLLDATAFIGGINYKSIIYPSFPMRLFTLFGYCWYLYIWLKSPKSDFKITFALIGCIGGVLITFHKPIVFATVFSTLSLFMIFFFLERKKNVTIARITGLIAIALIILMTFNSIYSNQVVDYVTDTFYSKYLRADVGTAITDLHGDDLMGASGGRLAMWPIAIDVIQQNLFFGTGDRTIFDTSADPIHVHNWFLDILVWGGIAGAIPFFLGFLWWFRFAGRSENIKQGTSVLLPVFAYTIGITAYNLGGTMFSFPTLLSFVMLLIAISVRYTKEIRC
jgi:hypothetical protein